MMGGLPFLQLGKPALFLSIRRLLYDKINPESPGRGARQTQGEAVMDIKKRRILGKWLQSLTKKVAIGVSEGGSGGNIVAQPVPEGVSVIKPNFDAGSMWSHTRKFPIADLANGGKIPYASQDSFGIAGVFGGAVAYSVAEAADMTPSAFTFNGVTKTLTKINVVIPVTREIIDDVDYLAEYISENGSIAAKVKLDDLLITGLEPVGICSAGGLGATYFQATITAKADLEAMVGKFHDSGNGASSWQFSKLAFNAILTNVDAYISILDFGRKTLFGIPYVINPSLQANAVVLGDWSQYGVIQKDVADEFDSGLYFLSDQMLFKTSIRVAGSPMWKGKITLDDAAEVWSFVASQTLHP